MPDQISAQDRGFLLGDGVFDTSMVLNGKMMFRDRHLNRLAEAADALGLLLDRHALEHTLEREISPLEAARVRITLSRGIGTPGPGAADQEPTCLIHAHPLDVSRQFRPVTAMVSSIERARNAPSSRYKTLSYIDNVMALREATQHGAECSLMIGHDQSLICGASENLFLLRGKELITPPVETGAMAGTLRAWIMDEAPGLGLPVQEASITLAAALSADAVFLTNSLRLIAPVTAIGERQLGLHWPDLLTDLSHHLLHDLKRQCGGRTPFGRPKRGDPYHPDQEA